MFQLDSLCAGLYNCGDDNIEEYRELLKLSEFATRYISTLTEALVTLAIFSRALSDLDRALREHDDTSVCSRRVTKVCPEHA